MVQRHPVDPNKCPATTTEFNGERAPCARPFGHTDLHTDGCILWTDPWGEVDYDGHAAFLRDQEVPADPRKGSQKD